MSSSEDEKSDKKTNVGKKWTDEETKYLVDNMKKLSNDKLAKKLKRTLKSVQCKIAYQIKNQLTEDNLDEMSENYEIPKELLSKFVKPKSDQNSLGKIYEELVKIRKVLESLKNKKLESSDSDSETEPGKKKKT